MKNMKHDYLKNLILQFKAATGRSYDDDFIDDFVAFVQERQRLGKKYLEVLSLLDVDTRDKSVCEVGKGYDDSLVLQNGKAMIISNYGDSMKYRGDNEIITGDLDIFNNTIRIVHDCKYARIDDYFVTCGIERLMTQNIYDENNYYKWALMHNSGKNIAIGIYGSYYDVDKDKKISKLEEMKTILDGNYIDCYHADIDSYSYVVASKRVRSRVSNK